MKQRNQAIDVLRVLGIFLVILAHTNISSLVFEIREFDVPLLVMLSGMSYFLTSEQKEIPYKTYVMQRMKRLLIPVWIFLAVFFIVNSCIPLVQLSKVEIVKSFLLLAGGLPFVWVFRIFFVVALMNPFLKKQLKKNIWVVCGVTIAVLILNEVVYTLVVNTSFGKIFSYAITYNVSYCALSLFGMLVVQANKKQRKYMIALFAGLFLILGLMNQFDSLYAYKHPPRMYYMSYGVCMTCLLYTLLEKVELCGISEKMITFSSKHCMDIYLAHIVLYFTCFSDSVLVNILILEFGSIAVVYLLDRVVRKLRYEGISN